MTRARGLPAATLLILAAVLPLSSRADGPLDAASAQDIRAAMMRAARYYREQVATHGGYVYYYSPDLQTRWGEGPATPDQIWVQPPGTPTVGLAFLTAYEATGDRYYLEAATDAALALVHGQLESGGWTNSVDFNPRGSQVARYRNGRGGGKKSRNFSTLDDGISQAALELLMRVDQAHEFRHERIRDALRYALPRLLAAQFPNGGFPQGWDEEPAPRPEPREANYPSHDWRIEGRIKNYWDMYTLNDGLAGTVARTLSVAADVYGDEKYEAALARLGDFLLAAQMPSPQPAWAQQYNYAMQPIWARRFEPAAIAGRESQDVLETLLFIARRTGAREKYLEPLPRAISYLRQSQLDDGRLARYYELRTNRPLYMFRRGREYTLTYDDGDLPRHYGWKVESRLDEVERAYRAILAGRPLPPPRPAPTDVARLMRELDSQGRWLSTYQGQPLVGQPKFAVGEKYLSSEVFSRNLETLAGYLAVHDN